MTREKFEEIRAEVLGEIKNAAERERIRAVTYAQGMQNQRDGLPLFGWNRKSRRRIARSWPRPRAGMVMARSRSIETGAQVGPRWLPAS